jgi:hypothetical protein
MEHNSRRSFLVGLFKDVVQNTVVAFEQGVEEVRKKDRLNEFFSSYESSYALTLNYPDDILLESARMEGIEIEGRERLEIVKELFLKKGGF